MNGTIIVTGTLTDRQHLMLDERLPFECGKVRVTIESVEGADSQSSNPVAYWLSLMNRYWDEQRRGVPTSAEMEPFARQPRESWGD